MYAALDEQDKLSEVLAEMKKVGIGGWLCDEIGKMVAIFLGFNNKYRNLLAAIREPEPRISYAYCFFINACAVLKLKDMAEAAKFQMLEKLESPPDWQTYECLILMACRLERYDLIEQYLEEATNFSKPLSGYSPFISLVDEKFDRLFSTISSSLSDMISTAVGERKEYKYDTGMERHRNAALYIRLAEKAVMKFPPLSIQEERQKQEEQRHSGDTKVATARHATQLEVESTPTEDVQAQTQPEERTYQNEPEATAVALGKMKQRLARVKAGLERQLGEHQHSSTPANNNLHNYNTNNTATQQQLDDAPNNNTQTTQPINNPKPTESWTLERVEKLIKQQKKEKKKRKRTANPKS
jgi:hypothetical protein